MRRFRKEKKKNAEIIKVGRKKEKLAAMCLRPFPRQRKEVSMASKKRGGGGGKPSEGQKEKLTEKHLRGLGEKTRTQ